MDQPILDGAIWRRLLFRTVVISLASAAVSLIAAQALMLVLSQGLNLAGVVASVLLPVVLGGPMLFYFQLRSHQLAEANRRLERLASIDWLTGCLNRRAFTLGVDKALANTGGEVAMLLIDADHFKRVNDRFGHERGDTVLRHLAQAIRTVAPPGALVGRLGGEEFSIFAADTTFAAAEQLAESIRVAATTIPLCADDGADCLTVSVGGVAGPGAPGFAQLFRLADAQLYEAKHAGRNRTQLCLLRSGCPDQAAAMRRAS